MWRRLVSGRVGVAAPEYLGVLVVLTSITAVVLASGIGGVVTTFVDRSVCMILREDHSGCPTLASRTAPESGQSPEPQLPVYETGSCVVSERTDIAQGEVFVVVVEGGQTFTVVRERLSDGSSQFTISDSGKLAAAVKAGTTAKVGGFERTALASAAAGGQLTDARIYELTGGQTAELDRQAAEAGGYGKLVEQQLARQAEDSRDWMDLLVMGPRGFNAVTEWGAGFLPFDPTPGGDWDMPEVDTDEILLNLFGVKEFEDRLGDADSRYLQAETVLQAEGEVGYDAGDAEAGVSGLIEAAAGARRITSGENEGDIELVVDLEGEANGSVSAMLVGAGLGGSSQGVATVTLDADNGYRPKTLEVNATAGYTTSGSLGLSLEDLASGSKTLEDLSSRLETARIDSSQGAGRAVSVTGELDLTDPAERRAAVQLATDSLVGGPAGTIRGLQQAFDEDGRITVETLDTTDRETGFEVQAAKGPGLGLEGVRSTETSTVRESLVRPPGEPFGVRECES